MPTLNFTQFSSPTDTVPDNDYVVGYNQVNGVNVEAKWNIRKLASDVLPGSGLSTKNHQIRKLARQNFEASHSMAAITRKEEVICWGNNTKANPYEYTAAGYTMPADRNLLTNNRYTKFGAGFESVDKAPAWQPVLIPFMNGAPSAENQDVLDLQAKGLTIVDLIWDEWAAMALLSDGSVWVKSIIGKQEFVGWDRTTLSTQSFFSAAFYKVTRWDLNSGETNIIASKIETFPMCAPICGGLFLALDQFGDLHLWGETSRWPVADWTLWPGGGSQSTSDIPVNITKSGNVSIAQKVRSFKISGDFHNRNQSIQIITTENKLFGIGYNRSGILGTATTGVPANHSNWTQAKFIDADNNDTVTFVTNAQSFVTGSNYFMSGYLSTASNNKNRLYLAGTNEILSDLSSIASVTPAEANNVYRGATQSGTNDLFVQGFINDQFTCVIRSEKGRIYSAGRNNAGEAGRSGAGSIPTGQTSTYVGPTFAAVGYKPSYEDSLTIPGYTSSSVVNFGTGLSAVDLFQCNTSKQYNTTGIKVVNSQGKYQLYLAGQYTFTSQFTSYLPRTSTFQLLPIKESVDQVAIGGDVSSANYCIVLTNTGRTYGVGYGPNGLIADSTHRIVTSGTVAIPTWSVSYGGWGYTWSSGWRRSWSWGYRTYVNYVYYRYNYTTDQSTAWSPQPTILF